MLSNPRITTSFIISGTWSSTCFELSLWCSRPDSNRYVLADSGFLVPEVRLELTIGSFPIVFVLSFKAFRLAPGFPLTYSNKSAMSAYSITGAYIKLIPESNTESPPLKRGVLPLKLVCKTTQSLPLY